MVSNEVVSKALAAIEAKNNRKALQEKITFAARAAKNFGVLSSIAISNRLDLKDYIDRQNYLTNQEKRALFYWCARGGKE